MKNLKWSIGNVEVHQIIEIEAGNIIQDIIKKATPKNIKDINWLYPYFADESGKLKGLVQSFLLKSNNKLILVDTCNGNNKIRTDVPEWGNLNTNYLDKLKKNNVNVDDIDIVLCTHLHFDHIGWNTKLENGAWVPTFPKAKYLFAKKEYDYWKQKPAKEIKDDKSAFDDSISPIVNHGLAKLIDTEYRIDKNIKLLSTPGHTPHHVSVLIESKNQKALITGDLIHHPCQIAEPSWFTDADTFPDQGIDTRNKILNEISDTNTILIGNHFSNPVAGKVVKDKGRFVFITDITTKSVDYKS